MLRRGSITLALGITPAFKVDSQALIRTTSILSAKASRICERQKRRLTKSYFLASILGRFVQYLEPHHIRRGWDSGPDSPEWVGGICPNCHREIHFGNGIDLNKKLKQKVSKREESWRITGGFDSQ